MNVKRFMGKLKLKKWFYSLQSKIVEFKDNCKFKITYGFSKKIINKDLERWINRDKRLYNKLLEIENSTDSIDEQAHIAFNEIPKMYDTPTMPDDINHDDEQNLNQASAYELLAQIKFLQPQWELRTQVLYAIFLLAHKKIIDINDLLKHHYGNNIKENSGIGYKGEGVNVEIIFVSKGENWFDLGCKYFTKYV